MRPTRYTVNPPICPQADTISYVKTGIHDESDLTYLESLWSLLVSCDQCLMKKGRGGEWLQVGGMSSHTGASPGTNWSTCVTFRRER